METVDNIGKNSMCWLHLKNITCEYISLFFCLFTSRSASVSALQIVFSNSLYESIAQWENLSDFQRDQIFGASLAAASVTETVTLLGNPEHPFAKL